MPERPCAVALAPLTLIAQLTLPGPLLAPDVSPGVGYGGMGRSLQGIRGTVESGADRPGAAAPAGPVPAAPAEAAPAAPGPCAAWVGDTCAMPR